MDHGIEIYLNQLSSIEIAQDGKTVKIGGGTKSKAVTDGLWAAGKQTGEFTVPTKLRRIRNANPGRQ
jgi:uncharacterized protein YdeI (YjbR/CyaY-like superfamily)